MTLCVNLDRDGHGRVAEAIPSRVISDLCRLWPAAGPNRRLVVGDPMLAAVVRHVSEIVAAVSPAMRAVRGTMFDKSPAYNWAVPWHQDRTIAVASRRDVAGFGRWSVKAGIVHVEPPFALLAAMLTVRVHLDDCDIDNAPLIAASGSHHARVVASGCAGIAASSPTIVCTALAGDVWLYATPILHASRRAVRARRRRVIQFDFAAGALPGGLDWAA